MTFLRWVAALMVLYGHAFVFLGLPEPLFLGYFPLGPTGVWIFFGISGYLVARSFERDPDVFRFMLRRALRIFPGLAVCIIVSVLLLGPLLTALPVSAYFRHPATMGYLDNLYLYVAYSLPGVFEHNRVANAVNGSLWSLPVEFAMYLGVALFGGLRLPRLAWILTTLALMLLSALWANRSTEILAFYRMDLRQVVMCGVFFWVGAVYQRYRIERHFTPTNVGLALIIWVSLSRWPQALIIATWLVLPFVTLAFGLARGSWLGTWARLDYSYGIYVYAFPVQQTLVQFQPDMNVWLHLALAIAITVALAGLSWHLVEQRALAYKPLPLPHLAQR
jgi:peptidoglycan/LPS O-acetylase OafA/YrhL